MAMRIMGRILSQKNLAGARRAFCAKSAALLPICFPWVDLGSKPIILV
jgi:hypothetical protein